MYLWMEIYYGKAEQIQWPHTWSAAVSFVNSDQSYQLVSQLVISSIIVRCIIGAILIIAGVRNLKITERTGVSERGICDLKNQFMSDEADGLFERKAGRGRQSRIKDVESQIVDMIHEKYETKVSLMSVSRLVKTKSASCKLAPCLSRLIQRNQLFMNLSVSCLCTGQREKIAHTSLLSWMLVTLFTVAIFWVVCIQRFVGLEKTCPKGIQSS